MNEIVKRYEKIISIALFLLVVFGSFYIGESNFDKLKSNGKYTIGTIEEGGANNFSFTYTVDGVEYEKRGGRKFHTLALSGHRYLVLFLDSDPEESVILLNRPLDSSTSTEEVEKMRVRQEDLDYWEYLGL